MSPPANDWTDPREQQQQQELEVEVEVEAEGEIVAAASHDPPSYDAAVEGEGNPSEPPSASSIPLAATPMQPVAAVVALPPAIPANESVRESAAAAKAAALPFLPGDMRAFEKATQSEDSARVSKVVSMAMQWYTEHDARIQAASSVAELAAIAAAIKTDVRHQLLLANHVDRLREAWREKDSEVRANPQAEPTEDDAAAIPGTNGGTPLPTDAALKEAPAMAGNLRNELAASASHCTPNTDNAECKTAQGSFARRPICGLYTVWFSSVPAYCFAFISSTSFRPRSGAWQASRQTASTGIIRFAEAPTSTASFVAWGPSTIATRTGERWDGASGQGQADGRLHQWCVHCRRRTGER